MSEILRMQENDANNAFVKYMICNYLSWLDPDVQDKPVLSPSLFSKKVFPLTQQGKPLFFILIDNLRFDQWKTIAMELAGIYRVIEEDIYFRFCPQLTVQP